MATKFICLVLSLLLTAGSLAAQGTAFTYQGRLTDAMAPATGLFDFRFRAYDQATNGYAVGSVLNILAVPVTNGLFTILLDLGANIFDGKSVWLEIATKNSFTDGLPVLLSPRQQITSTPYAITAANLMSAGPGPIEIKVNGQRTLRMETSSVSPNVIGGHGVNFVAPGVSGATIGGGGAVDDGEGTPLLNQVTANYGTISGGAGNTAQASGSTVSGGSKNFIGQEALSSVIGGGAGNSVDASDSFLGGGNGNSIAGGAGFSSLVGGIANVVGPNAAQSAIGGGGGNKIEAPSATVAGGAGNQVHGVYGVISGGELNLVSDWYGTVSGGGFNQAQGRGATVGGGGGLSLDILRVGNTAAGLWSTVSGGAENTNHGNYATTGGGLGNWIGGDSSFSTIAGGERNRIAEEAWNSSIGGGEINAIETQTDTATIAGGGYNLIGASADSATIGGGIRNAIGFDAEWATISGGGDNLVSGQSATIGGGQNNVANSGAATIAGGFANTASGAMSTVSGGRENVAYGELAVIPGGFSNSATNNAFAAGSRAKARHSGAFLWADASHFDFSSSNGNEFAVRATGGSRFVSALDATGAASAGVTLAPGSGSWSMLSDRNAKENFEPADTREVLEKLTQLPVSRWSYKSQDKSVQHLGPVAQDFRAAFGLGENDTTISTVDGEGVALAAIQGLNQKLEEKLNAKDAEIAALTKRLAGLEDLVKQLGRGSAPIAP